MSQYRPHIHEDGAGGFPFQTALEGSPFEKLSEKGRRRFIQYIGFRAQQLKSGWFRWPAGLDWRRVEAVFGQEGDLPWEGLNRTPLAGRAVVIGGGHGTAWVGELDKFIPYTLIQGPDDDGFGALIYPLGVTVPAGDIINSFLSIARVGDNDAKLLKFLNNYNLGPAPADDTIADRRDYQGYLFRQWDQLRNLSRKVEEGVGARFDNRNLAAFIDFYNEFFLDTPIAGIVPPDFHDAREGLMYGLFLYHSPYRERLKNLRPIPDYRFRFANPAELRIIATALSSRHAINGAIQETRRILNIPERCRHLVASFQDRALGGFYSDGRGPFTGVQNTPRGSDDGSIHPRELYICRATRRPHYPALEPNCREAIAATSTRAIIRSCGSLATTSGQIFATPGMAQANRRNPGAARIFIFNNCPELAEGESRDPLLTLARAEKYFHLPIPLFCQYALVPDPAILAHYPDETRIEQRPGESVPVNLVRPDGRALMDQGITPVFHDAIRSERRPDLHDNAKLARAIARILSIHQWETDQGLHFCSFAETPKVALAKKSTPHPILPKEVVFQRATAFAETLFSNAKIGLGFTPFHRFRLIQMFRDLACIERFPVEILALGRILHLAIFPFGDTTNEAEMETAEIDLSRLEEGPLARDFAFTRLLETSLPPSSTDAQRDEIIRRTKAIHDSLNYFNKNIKKFYHRFSPTHQRFPPPSPANPEGHSLLCLEGETLYCHPALFENPLPIVLSRRVLASFHALWADLSRPEPLPPPMSRFFAHLRRDIPGLAPLGDPALDILLFSFLLPRGRDLFHLSPAVKEKITSLVPKLRFLYQARLLPTPSKGVPIPFDKAEIISDFLQQRAIQSGTVPPPRWDKPLPRDKREIFVSFQQGVYQPGANQKFQRANPNLDPFLNANPHINAQSQRERLQFLETPMIRDWYDRITMEQGDPIFQRYRKWIAGIEPRKPFTKINSDFFSHLHRWTKGIDPFFVAKTTSFTTALTHPTLLFFLNNGGAHENNLEELLDLLLLGNREDHFVGHDLRQLFRSAPKALIDDRPAAIKVLRESQRILLHHDNSGLEILGHLILIDALLKQGKWILSFGKPIPFYVSDVTPQDLTHYLTLLVRHSDPLIQGFGGRLQRAIANGRWTIPNGSLLDFYVSGGDYSATPPHLREFFRAWGVDLHIYFGESHRGLFYGSTRGAFGLTREGVCERRFGEPIYGQLALEQPVLLMSSVKSPILLRGINPDHLDWNRETHSEAVASLTGETIVDFFPIIKKME